MDLYLVLLQLSKSTPKPQFFSNIKPYRKCGFRLYWRFRVFGFQNGAAL